MPSAAILPASLAIPTSSNRTLSSCWTFTGPDLFHTFSIASSSLRASSDLFSVATIRMGGGPRTFPGGVSKWQWKRMQAKKSKQLLKARLCRERQLYEMRKRTELKAAISELERPWEAVERAPVLFSISADEQIKALADRFQRPSGFDMWSERDGPRLFHSPNDLPSARFFPKGAVHSVKPYGTVAGELTDGGEEGDKEMRNDDWIAKGAGGMGRGRRAMVLPDSSSLESERSVSVEEENGDAGGNRGSYYSDSELLVVSSSKAEDKLAGRYRLYGGNHGSPGSDSERVVDSSRLNGDDTVSDFRRRGGRRRNWDSWRSNSEPGEARSRMDRQNMASSFGGGRRNWDSRGSNSEPAEAGSRMERQKMASSFGRRGRGGGRGRYRDSYGSHSKSAVTGSSMERDEMANTFGQRYGGDRNQSSSESYSDLAITGSRMPRREKAGGFDWRRARGGRDGNRNSYRSYSEHEKDKNEGDYGKRDDRGGNRNATADGFDRRGGRGGNRVSYRSYSNLAVAGSRMERDVFVGGLRKRGGRGRNPNSYDSDSELAITDSRKGRVQMDGVRNRDYRNAGRVSLRPTTELRLKDRDVRR